ncbi:MAG: SAM-dependent methyltransferase [Carbonactinosporaceae bacterium]
MSAERSPERRVDTSRPSPARIYDYALGGKDNYAVDREAAQKVREVFPEAFHVPLANRLFLVRAVRYCAEQGIDQFIDIGTGLPTPPNVPEIARKVHPHARVVGVDNDPIVLNHNRALVAVGEGLTTIEGDVRDPDQILDNPELRALIDLDRPVVVLLVAILHFIRDEADPGGIVARLAERIRPGSYVAISTTTSTGAPAELLDRIEQVYANATARMIPRPEEQIHTWFDPLSLVEPGVVDLVDWRPQLQEWVPSPGPLMWPQDLRTDFRMVGGVAQKL